MRRDVVFMCTHLWVDPAPSPRRSRPRRNFHPAPGQASSMRATIPDWNGVPFRETSPCSARRSAVGLRAPRIRRSNPRSRSSPGRWRGCHAGEFTRQRFLHILNAPPEPRRTVSVAEYPGFSGFYQLYTVIHLNLAYAGFVGWGSTATFPIIRRFRRTATAVSVRAIFCGNCSRP